MKHIKLFFGLTLCALLGATACQDSFDNPVLQAPQATKTPNSTILEVKEKYWDDATNYIDTVKLTDEGKHVIIAGRVISSDEDGNIYKSLVIQDNTAALVMSINANSLYNYYRIGQEIVIDLTDMYLGKYNGLQQLGFPEVYRDAWEATFMPLEFFKAHSELNDLPAPSKVDTITATIPGLETDAAGLRKWQGQLVRFNNVHFEGADGKLKFVDQQKVTANRTLVDENGASILVRNSGYAKFYNDVLPYDDPKTEKNEGVGDVCGILSYYGSQWQLLLRSISDCMNFGNPTLTPGTEDNPYSVDQAIELQNSGASGWVKGYIVGAVAPEVEEITSNDQIEWTAPTTLANTLVIGATPDTKDIKSCLVIALPQDSKFREYGNLKDHPELLKREIQVLGRLETFMGVFGITGNKGTVSEFKIEGVDPGGNPSAPGDGTKEKPYNVAQVQGGTATGTAWVTGYIVGWVEGITLADGAHFDVPATVASNMLIASSADETDYTKCLPIQLPTGNIRTALNLMDNPGNLGKVVKLHGSIEKYFGQTGVKSVDDYVLDGDTPEPPAPGGDATSIADLYTKTGKDNKTVVKVNFPMTVTYFSSVDARYTYVTDGTSYSLIYGKIATPYEKGQIIPAGWEAKVQNYNGLIEIIPNDLNAMPASTGTAEVNYFSGDASFVTVDNQSKVVVMKDVVFAAATPGEKAAFTGKVNGVEFNLYNTYTLASVPAGTYTVTGVVAVNKNNPQLIPLSYTGDTPEPPVDDWVYADFNTFNGGKANSKYGTADTFYSTTSGWKAVFSCILSGSAADPGSNPAFHFISSDPTVLAACMTGNTNNPGSIVSPAISGGYSAIKFNYGLPYTDTKLSFKMTLFASVSGSLVKLDEKVITVENPAKQTAYEYVYEGSVDKDFIIQFDNLSPSAAASNKDRVAIWNVAWKKFK